MKQKSYINSAAVHLGQIGNCLRMSGFEQFLHPMDGLDLSSPSGVLVRCMDDRPGEKRGIQLPGGVFGIATAAMIAAEAENPGYANVVSSNASIGDFASTVRKILNDTRGPRVPKVEFHENCAGRGKVVDIIGVMFDDGPLVSETAAQLSPRAVTAQSDLDLILNSARRVRESGIVHPGTEEATRKLLDPRTHEMPSHQATDFVVMHGTVGSGQIDFDTTAAWTNGTPAYGLNVGLWEELGDFMSRELSDYFGPIDPQKFSLAAIAYTSATIGLLPMKKQPTFNHFGLVA